MKMFGNEHHMVFVDVVPFTSFKFLVESIVPPSKSFYTLTSFCCFHTTFPVYLT